MRNDDSLQERSELPLNAIYIAFLTLHCYMIPNRRGAPYPSYKLGNVKLKHPVYTYKNSAEIRDLLHFNSVIILAKLLRFCAMFLQVVKNTRSTFQHFFEAPRIFF